MSVPKVKLIHFPNLAYCELIRVLLAAGGQEYEDETLEYKTTWLPRKEGWKI